MGRIGRTRRMAALVAGGLVAVGLATTTATIATAGAVPTKVPKDPCAVMTATDLRKVSTPYSISDTTSELEDDCTYSLEADGSTTPLQLFVQSSIGYSAQKAVTRKVKKVSGLPGGYSGVLPGGSHEVAYKSGKTSIRLSSGDVSTADLIAVLKSIHQRLG
jgi:hypothetical protein